MSDFVKENIRQTTGGGGGGGAVTIDDGTASGGATVLPTPTTTPAGTDNPLLTRAVIGDETNVADLLPVAANNYSPGDITPGARNVLMTAAVITGAQSGTNTAIRMVSVLDGIGTVEAVDDNPLFTRPANRTSAVYLNGAAVSCAGASATTVAPANPDRRFLSIKNNSGGDVTMRLGGAAAASDIELKDEESFTMDAGAIYTGLVSIYNPAVGAVDIHVIEF